MADLSCDVMWCVFMFLWLLADFAAYPADARVLSSLASEEDRLSSGCDLKLGLGDFLFVTLSCLSVRMVDFARLGLE